MEQNIHDHSTFVENTFGGNCECYEMCSKSNLEYNFFEREFRIQEFNVSEKMDNFSSSC